MAYNIVVDHDYMAALEKLYRDSATDIEGAIARLSEIKEIYISEYEGHATLTAPETADKALEHLRLLKDCCDNLAAYVLHCDGRLTEADRRGGNGVSVE